MIIHFFLTIDVLVSSNLHFHSLLSYGNSPQWLPCSFLLGFGFGLVGLLECSWAPSSFVLRIVAKSLSSCLCLFDTIIEL